MTEKGVPAAREVLLDLVDVLRLQERRTQVLQLQVAVGFALQHGQDAFYGERVVLPGREHLVTLGGQGTPLVAEFAPAIFAARLGKSPSAGARLIADALDLRYRLPRLWTRVEALEVEASYAREVARRTRTLTCAQAALVDEQVAEEADGRLPWSRFTDLIEAAVISADPATAAKREQEAASRYAAAPTRSNEYGMRGFFVQAPFPVIARLDATVAYLAQALLDFGDTTSLDERRVKAVLILANPTQAVQVLRAYATWRAQRKPTSDDAKADKTVPVPDPELDGEQQCTLADVEPGPDTTPVLDDKVLLPAVRLFVHLTQDTIDNDCTGVARVEGQPPITAQWVKRHLGGCRITVTPVLDLANQIPVDAWEIPQRHRHAVHLMTPADTFPFATNTTRSKQIDHTIPYQASGPPGQSGVGNYGPMTVFHHRLKTHGGWHVAQPFPGIYLWRDPTNTATYLVDHTGTRRLEAG